MGGKFMLNRYKFSFEEEKPVVLGIVAQQCELFNAAEQYTLKGKFCIFIYSFNKDKTI